ncbi:MAG: PepSY domain-containing protein [Isosphaeraceae bacterium]
MDLVVDGKTGAIKDRKDFYDRHVIDRVVGTGIAAHEGQLFGWPNQLLGRITAAGLILLCTSSVVMWWRRRDVGVLGAPKAAGKPRLSLSFLALVILLGVYRPLFGAPLLAVLLVEKALLCRIPRIRDWLGLQLPRERSLTPEFAARSKFPQ